MRNTIMKFHKLVTGHGLAQVKYVFMQFSIIIRESLNTSQVEEDYRLRQRPKHQSYWT